MKKTFMILSTTLFAMHAFAVEVKVQKDECYSPIMTAMKAIAKTHTRAVSVDTEVVANYFKIEQDGYFVDLKAATKKSEERRYEVKLATEFSSERWIATVSAPEGSKACIIRGLNAAM